MDDNTLAGRRSILVAAAASALLPMEAAVAQTARGGGDWFAMVKAHHLLISKTFSDLLDARGKLFSTRTRLQRTLAYQLTAHSVAEENTLYPALATQGLLTESDKLYLDQAHAKVMNAQLEMSDAKNEADWFGKVSALQAAVLKHAQQDEEADIYPRLQQSLSAPMNAALSVAYAREFASVRKMPADV